MKFPLQWGPSDYPDSLDDFLQDLLGMYTDVMPLEVVATLVFGTFALATYIRQDSPIIVLGFVMLAGGAFMPLVAPVAVGITMLGVMLFGAGIMVMAWYIYSD